jgi:glycosyltransferase involved in cell wall biosynthesis
MADVIYVLPNKLGGVFNYVGNLLAHRQPDAFTYAAIRTNNTAERDTLPSEPLPADRDVRFDYGMPPENVYSVMRRLVREVPHGPGVIVANGWVELAMASLYDTGRTVVAINHGDFDYYYNLALRYRDTIDAWVTYSERMFSRLREILPDRTSSIFLLPYGVDIPTELTRPATGPLRLLYVGRLHEDKGILDLPLIDRRLRERGIDATWTVQGEGPHETQLRTAWTDRPDVRWSGVQPMTDVLRLYTSHDVLVMPSRAEGLPVALLEAGARGVVPVVSDLPSGIPEVVTPGQTGFRPATGDIDGFAGAIAQLANDRTALAAMSSAIRIRVADRYDASRCTAAYQALYARAHELKRPWKHGGRLSYASRLDQPWIPNAFVKAVRTVTARRSPAMKS